MSRVCLVRHGQAGTRNRYDTLSPLGRTQARRLGEWMAAQGIRFTNAVSGALDRQQETAREVEAAYREAGLPFPGIAIDPGWSEFDLDAVYRGIAPVLAAADPAFRGEYERMLAQSRDDGHEVHRRWTRCDLLVLRAWLEGSVAVKTESWGEFQARIQGALGRLNGSEAGARVAVFTSATPIGVACGTVLGADEHTRIRLTGALYNSAFAELQRREDEWSLFSFNNIPHLAEQSTRTFR